MKLDASAAWDGAIKMLAANREVVLILVGVFFFLPYLVFSLFLPDPMAEVAAGPNGPDMDAVSAAVAGFYGEYWWALVLLVVVQGIGVIALLAVLGDPGRPTVQDALARGVRFLPTQLAAQVLTGIVAMAPIVLGVAIGAATGSQAIAAVLILLAVPVTFYLVIKLSMSAPAIAVERLLNPLTALKRSWRLTKGNSFRLFFFYLLLLLAFVVASLVISLVFGLVFALGGEQMTLIGGAVAGSLVNAIFAVVAYAVLASIHTQLARQPASVPITHQD